jgi:hypothetical protein
VARDDLTTNTIKGNFEIVNEHPEEREYRLEQARLDKRLERTRQRIVLWFVTAFLVIIALLCLAILLIGSRPSLETLAIDTLKILVGGFVGYLLGRK